MNNDLISREALNDIWKLYKQYQPRLAINVYEFGEALRELIDNAPTVCGNNPKWCESCVSKGKCASARPQGERAERALAIIDRLRTDGHINNKEQGTLRRAILLPERPQGEITNEDIQQAIKEGFANGYEMAKAKFSPKKSEWGKWIITEIQCPNCFGYFVTDCYSKEELNKCPVCGEDMRKGGAE